jgi:mono/diheme cytochrome c family protein
MSESNFKDTENAHAANSVDVTRMHAPIYREQFEPEDGYEPMPTSWLMCILMLALGCGWYLGSYSGNFSFAVLDGDEASAQATAQAPAATAAVDPKVLGARVYNNCMACHQGDGKGIAGQFPPLAGSEWVLGDTRVLARILLHGLGGPIEVAGKTYDGPMPAWQRLSDAQIAGVLTYIRSSFGNTAAPVDEAQIAQARTETAERRAPWTPQELQALAPP